MQEYAQYNVYINKLIKTHLKEGQLSLDTLEATRVVLDGGAAQNLREQVSTDKLRKYGAFFTGSRLADLAVASIAGTLSSKSIILDNSCGAGDLLIACTKHLKLGRTIEETLRQWGKQILAHDISDEFIKATKLRLILSAISRAGLEPKLNLTINENTLFPQVIKADGLKNPQFIKCATHIVINPPFVRIPAPDWCNWSKGKVNSAALFLEQCVVHAQEGTRIVAILPDVLRSGTNYSKWRKKIESRAIQHHRFLHGQFDRFADVDVFVIDLEITNNPSKLMGIKWQHHNNGINCRPQVKDKFDVHCGRVVEYRDPHEGDTHQYITPKTLPSWQTVTKLDQSRKFRGKTYSSPFVAVRRTSRKSHEYRAVGTIVNTSGTVAVENHLLVLSPKSGLLADCYDLLNRLKSEKTNEWLNETIRCRHLTVSSLKELPWWDEDEYR